MTEKWDDIVLTKEEADRLFSMGEVEVTWADTRVVKIMLGE